MKESNANGHDVVADVKEKFGMFGLNVMLVLTLSMMQSQQKAVEFRLADVLRIIGEKPDSMGNYSMKQLKRVKKVMEYISAHQGYRFTRVSARQEVPNG